ncbi:lipopolysaccharide biosynthesis protein [Acinetobacter haemolyticus]|uniref:Lipopolysaccharide biosynthesis protein n=1 Tax=Acinetobacter haemolyticus TaxID=29430 RepID=A0AAJ2YRR6_ACIHA|nr:lipopolysaccharide biosynthesis protein [Acinetobacter haemolyticus]NAR64331.1 lipopolysaccharide biosynthesis protein [Acinetobacter haemolyticus]NAR72367.1 lipopolysaccharide biosynthesis protein [Acinetobacter haemolyticus]
MFYSFSNQFLRNIYKLVYKILFPREYKHNRHFWPLYQVQRNEYGRLEKVYFKKQLVSDNLIHTHAENKKCMLIATGPSIQRLEQKNLQLPDIDYIGVNGAISLDLIKFSNYVIIDHNFIECRFDLVKKVLMTDCNFYTTPRCLDIILRQVQFQDIRCQIKTIETITDGIVETFLDKAKFFNESEQDFYTHNNFRFSKDIFKGTFDYYTVAYVALQIIHTLNYKEIYIAGLDMNNFSQPRFYESLECKQPTTLNNHVDDVFQALHTAALFFQENNIKAFNLSKESAVESFEKIDTNLF